MNWRISSQYGAPEEGFVFDLFTGALALAEQLSEFHPLVAHTACLFAWAFPNVVEASELCGGVVWLIAQLEHALTSVQNVRCLHRQWTWKL